MCKANLQPRGGKRDRKEEKDNTHPLCLSSQTSLKLFCISHVYVCVGMCMFLYTTGTQLNPTLITIRLVIDHTHAVSIDPACAVL